MFIKYSEGGGISRGVPIFISYIYMYKNGGSKKICQTSNVGGSKIFQKNKGGNEKIKDVKEGLSIYFG